MALLAAAVSGRLLVGALGARLLVGFGPDAAALSTLLGASAITVAFARLSGLGLDAPAALRAILVLHLVLAAATLLRRRLRAFRPRGDRRVWLTLVLALATTVTVSLFPVLRTDGLAINNDTFTYCAFSQWLQGNGFGTRTKFEPASPLTYFPALWQETEVGQNEVREAPTLGAAFVLALVQASTGADSALSAYPATAALGMGLCTAGLWLLARFLARLRAGPALVAGLAFATLPHPLFFGHHNGFLQQTYGMAGLLGALALASRVRSRRPTEAFAWLAVAGAFLLVVYLPLFPVLVVAAAVPIAAGLWRSRRHGETWRSLLAPAAALALLLAMAFREIAHGLWRLPHLAQIVAGWHVPVSGVDFLAFTMGASGQGVPHGPGLPDVVGRLLLVLAPLWAGLAALGFAKLWKTPRTGPLFAVLATLGGLFLYYRLVAVDPWTNEPGHSWNLFRLAQWAYPLTLVGQVAGLYHLRRSWPAATRALGVLVVLPALLLAIHWGWSRPLGLGMRRIIASETPLADLPKLRRAFADLPSGTLLLVGRAANRHLWLGAYASLLAYPRGLVGDWEGSAGVHAATSAALYRDLLGRVGEPGIVPILGAVQPFVHAGLAPLGGGFARIVTVDRPTVLYVASPASRLGPRTSPSSPGFQVGFGRAKFVVLSASRATVDLSLQREPDGPTEATASVDVFTFPEDVTNPLPRRLIEESAPVGELRLDAADGEWSVPVPVEAGLNTVVLSAERRGVETSATGSPTHSMRSAVAGLRPTVERPATRR